VRRSCVLRAFLKRQRLSQATSNKHNTLFIQHINTQWTPKHVMQFVRALSVTAGGCRCGTLRPFSSITASGSSTTTQGVHDVPEPPLSSAPTNAFAGLSRKQLQAYHALVRTAQVSDALARGFQEGTCTSTAKGQGRKQLQNLLRATRTRPSLLTPLAQAVGIALRCLPVPPGAGLGNVKQGLVSSMEESYDSSVRQLIEMERAENAKAPAATVKQFMKAKRDGFGKEDEKAGTGESSGVLTQATQIIIRTLIKGAERF